MSTARLFAVREKWGHQCISKCYQNHIIDANTNYIYIYIIYIYIYIYVYTLLLSGKFGMPLKPPCRGFGTNGGGLPTRLEWALVPDGGARFTKLGSRLDAWPSSACVGLKAGKNSVFQ